MRLLFKRPAAAAAAAAADKTILAVVNMSVSTTDGRFDASNDRRLSRSVHILQ
jgi:hypothetical protein